LAIQNKLAVIAGISGVVEAWRKRFALGSQALQYGAA
jgi:hypothetical protein